MLLPSIVVPRAFVMLGFWMAVVAYYLVWKYVVGFLNQVLGVA